MLALPPFADPNEDSLSFLLAVGFVVLQDQCRNASCGPSRVALTLLLRLLPASFCLTRPAPGRPSIFAFVVFVKLSPWLDQSAAGALLGLGQLGYSGIVGHGDLSGYQ